MTTAQRSVTECPSLLDYVTHATHVKTFWQFPGAHREPFDLKPLIKTDAGQGFHKGWKGRDQEITGLIPSYNSFP